MLHVLHSFSAGGLENGLVNIINHSPDHLQHQICLMTRGGDFLNRLNKPVPFYEIRKPGGNSTATLVRLRRMIAQTGADIVHTRNWGAFDAVLACCLIPRVTVLHGEHGRDIGDPAGLIRRRNRTRRLFSFRIRNYIAVSRDLQEWLSKVVGIAEKKILFIANGVDTERFQPRRNNALRQEMGFAPSDFVVGTVGRLDPIKNHIGILGAIRKLAAKPLPVRLAIVGDGPERANLAQAVEHMALSDHVTFAGYRPDVVDFYGVFDVFVLNSLAEGMSNTILEAMASGLPVVCTQQGGNVELVEEEVTGSFVEARDDGALAESMERLCLSPELRAEMGRASRLRAENRFSLKTMVDRYVRLYESTAGRGA